MCDSRRRARFAAAALTALAVLAALAALSGCTPFQLKQILDGPKGKVISISPTSTIIPANGTVTFAGDGGVPPYVYSIVSGGGTLNATTGAYTAPLVTGTAVIRVTDKTGKGAEATVTIQVLGVSLAASPGALSIAVGSNVTLSAIGGTPPYSWTISTNLSGSTSAPGSGASWLYMAGPTPGGVDVVQLKDSTNTTVTANITVTPLSSAVDYTIPTTSFSSTGTAGTAIPGGNTFTIHNSGQAGTQNITWKVYLSSNTVIDGGDVLVATGTTGPVGTGADSVVTVTGTYPAGPPGPGYLIATVSATDETNQGNNASGASAFTMSPRLVDYVVDTVTHTTGTITGSAMSGTLTLHNIGSADGAATVNWTVYASTDAVLDASDYAVAFGTQAPLAASTVGAPVTFNGYWPSTPGPWYLIAVVSASDDIGPGNNTTASVGTVTVTGPAPANVDYTVVSLANAGGSIAGDPLSGTFAIHNAPSAAGSLPIYWTAYLSSNTTLEIGTDQVIDSGSLPSGLAAGASSSTITFNGTWPSTPGTWYLIVAVSAPDDLVPGNNVSVTGAVATTAQNINYTVQTLGSTGGTTAGGALAGNLSIRNVGSHAGAQFVPYSVFLSTDTVLNIGTDQLIAVGSIPAPGLASNTTSASLPFAGTWPASNAPSTWFLIASVGAGDDVDATNNVVVSAAIPVTPPNIDYSASAPVSTGGTSGGGPLAGNFQITNNGSAGGVSTVAWTVYMSPTPVLNITTERVIATGTNAALPATTSSGAINFTGTWPAGTANWYLIVTISAADDINSANDTTGGTLVPVTGVNPVYTITSVPLPTGSTTGQAVSGTFTVKNTGTAAGGADINWQVWASLGNTAIDSGDVLLNSGTISGGLPVAGTSSPSYSGANWPSAAGTWYIVVRVSAADAPAATDVSSPAVAVVSPPAPDYTISFDPNIPWTGIVGTAMSLTGTTQVTINNISANLGHQNVTWAVYLSTDNVLDAGDTLLQQGTIGPLAGAGSQVLTFAGNWPATPGKIYWLIATVHASDDANPTNDVVFAPHTVAAGDYRYVEGAENNNGNGTNPPVAQTSNTLVGSTYPALGANMTLVIEGVMDAFGKYDTYMFATGATMSKLSMRAMWATGFDDIDLYLWDTGATNLSSIEVGINSEPGNGTFDVTSVTPRTCYVSANFWLNNNTSGSTGQKYFIFVKGLP